jgi:hypothetical protein
MKNIRAIKVQTPCHQNWHNMQNAHDGKFCMACQKNVVDFTILNIAEILNRMAKSGEICAKIENSQLSQINYQLALKRKSGFSRRILSAAAAFIGIFPSVKSMAQQPLRTEQGPVRERNIFAVNNTLSATFSGTVIDRATGLPLSGAGVWVKTGDVATQTNSDGEFEITMPSNDDTLVFNYIGYESAAIKIDGSKGAYIKIALQPINIVITGYAMRSLTSTVGGIIAIRWSFFHRLWYHITWPVRKLVGS